MKLRMLLEGFRQIRLQGPANVEISGVTEDSREVRPGFLFAALQGTRADGAQFIADAIRRGASAILTPSPFPLPQKGVWGSLPQPPRVRGEGAWLIAAEPRKTFAELAAAFYGRPSSSLKILSVTGTNGKTTVTYLLRQLLEAQDIPTGWIGTVGYAWGPNDLASSHTTPSASRLQSLLSAMLKDEVQAVSMEVSSHALDQYRVDGVDFDVALFTNLSRDHLDYHRTMEAYLNAKLRLFELLNDSRKPHRCAVIPTEDPAADEIQKIARVPVLRYGRDAQADVRASNEKLTKHGAAFDLESPAGKAKIHTPLLGHFNVSNILAAIAGGLAIGLNFEAMVQTLRKIQAPPGRMEFVGGDQPFYVVVDYAHTDDALKNVLMTVREFTQGRVLVVFGCGGDRDRTKRPLMGRVAEELADVAFITSDNPRSEDPGQIIREVEKGFRNKGKYSIWVDRKAAIEQAIAEATPGDLVLIAGKGHEAVQVLVEGSVPFSDRMVAQEAIGRLSKERVAACKS